MTSYLNTHLAIEGLRQDAQDRREQGPRVMIIGPSDVGKTSLCKIFLSYALRQGRQPIFVSLDTNEGSITMPGTLTATSITHIIDVEEGFGSSATTAASMGSSTMPLAYYFGHPSPAENVKLYRIIMSRLAHSVKCRMAGDEEGEPGTGSDELRKGGDRRNGGEDITDSILGFKVGGEGTRVAGLIIDTTGLIDHVGYEIIQHAIEEFSDVLYSPWRTAAVNVVVALGHERLYSDMVRILKDNANVSVLKLAKSGGVRHASFWGVAYRRILVLVSSCAFACLKVVERDAVFRRQLQMNKIHEYFYGTPKCDLSPYNTIFDSDLHFPRFLHSYPRLITYALKHAYPRSRSNQTLSSPITGSLAPSSALPLGMDRAVSETQLVKVDAGDILLHSVLAVSNAETAEDEAGLIETNLAGFIYMYVFWFIFI
ncbi:Molybdopterin guanine dinucleotide synthesis protein B-domain-containing protein [Endogone sp. FLAS-F59071]|nr:Molybdopterin guanine dinucleotide synthesis protein B-domain-containing protein [Endogone sp. FLAS-F59071]|eukprot:RUS16866.1 Molybdopterin guanine dinucleotide synthesis protein B-domain-containing protein [Endogone sp. FLAS-F59071]